MIKGRPTAYMKPYYNGYFFPRKGGYMEGNR